MNIPNFPVVSLFMKSKLEDLSKNDEVIRIIMEGVFKSLGVAIESKLIRVPIIKLSNLNKSVWVSRDQYKNVLNTVLAYYEERQNFEQCAKIKNLIDQLNEQPA